jgi:Ala-tRNA(Pro) deacylase
MVGERDRILATPDHLFAVLDQLAIRHRTIAHPPLFTVAESQQLRGEIPGGHTKNLFLRDKRGALFLVAALENAAIDLKRLHLRLGAGRLSFVSPAQMHELIGVEPGAVTPFAVINDTSFRVTTVLDAEMIRQPILNFHPLVNTLTTALCPKDLVKFLEATGHPPKVLAISATASITRADTAAEGVSRPTEG